MDKFPVCFDQSIGMNLEKIPISDFLLHPSHTPLFRSYSVISREGCEGTSFTPAGITARYASIHRFVFESQELTDIQAEVEIVKDHFWEFIRDEMRTF